MSELVTFELHCKCQFWRYRSDALHARYARVTVLIRGFLRKKARVTRVTRVTTFNKSI